MQLTKEFLQERLVNFKAKAQELLIDAERFRAVAEWTDELITMLDKPEPEAPVETES